LFHSSILDERIFWRADFYSDYYIVVGKVGEKFGIKKAALEIEEESLILR